MMPFSLDDPLAQSAAPLPALPADLVLPGPERAAVRRAAGWVSRLLDPARGDARPGRTFILPGHQSAAAG